MALSKNDEKIIGFFCAIFGIVLTILFIIDLTRIDEPVTKESKTPWAKNPSLAMGLIFLGLALTIGGSILLSQQGSSTVFQS